MVSWLKTKSRKQQDCKGAPQTDASIVLAQENLMAVHIPMQLPFGP